MVRFIAKTVNSSPRQAQTSVGGKRSERAHMIQKPQGIDKFNNQFGHRRTKT